MRPQSILEDVDPKRPLNVSGTKIHHITSAVRRYVVKNALRRCTMRIDKRCSPTSVNILKKEIFHQPGFASPRTADDIQVSASVLIGDGNRNARRTPYFVVTKIYKLGFVIHTSKTSPSSTQKPEMVSPFHLRKRTGLLRRVSKKCLSLSLCCSYANRPIAGEKEELVLE
jgi:hypothetical protein